MIDLNVRYKPPCEILSKPNSVHICCLSYVFVTGQFVSAIQELVKCFMLIVVQLISTVIIVWNS